MIKKLFRQMLLTQILSSMTVVICMLIDSIMIGHFLGVNAIAAYGLASPVLLIFAALGSMLSTGIQVVTGKTMGSGDRKGTNACYSASLFLSASLSLIGVSAVILFISPLCVLLGAEEGTAVFFLTKDYLTGFIVGAPAFMLAQIMVPFMQISGQRTRLIIAVAAMTVSDILFDLLNVLVFHGDILGMGLASSLSYYIAIAIGLVYFFRKDCIFKFRFRSVRLRGCLALMREGVPTVVNQISFVFLVYLLNKLLLDIDGNVAVAAYSVVSSVANICYSFGAGIGSVALTMASMFYSEEDRTSLYSLVRIMSVYAVLIDAVVTAAVILVAPAFVTLFLRSNLFDARDITVFGVRLFALCLIPCSLNTTFKLYYQGIHRVGLTHIISVLQNFLFTAIYALILSRFWGTTGIWLAFVCGETTTFLAISAYVRYKNGRVSLSAEAYALLPEHFGVSPQDSFDTSIRSIKEIDAAAAQALTFCREHEMDSKTQATVFLCIDIMVNNIIKHGFREGEEHSIDIRLFRKEEGWLIRIRDNCRNFDPVKYMQLHKVDLNESPVGIHRVLSLVKKANYVNSLGLNNLTMLV